MTRFEVTDIYGRNLGEIRTGSDRFEDPEGKPGYEPEHDWRATFEAVPDTNGQTALYFDTSTDTAPGMTDVLGAIDRAAKEVGR